MAKILSEKERKLQKKLIPLNIFVCILSLVAAASLMFGQIFCIDVGKILRSESTIAFVDETVNNIVDESTSGGEEGNQVDFRPVVSMIIKNVLGSAEGSVNVSAFNSAKVAFHSDDDKAEKVMDELFFGEGALVTKLIDSIVDNVANMFKTKEGKQLMEEIVVTTITASLVANLSEEDAAKITQEISNITATLHEFDNAKSRDEAAVAADKFIDKLDDVLGESFKEADGEAVKDYILGMYDDTTAETDDFSVEAMIAVTVSKNVDLSSFDLGGLFDGLVGEPEGSTHKRIVEDEIGGTETGSGEEEGGNENPDVTDPDNPDPIDPDNPDPEPVDPDPDNPDPIDPDNPDPEPVDPDPEPNPGEDDKVICTTYEELLKEMGLDDSKTEELKTTLRTSLQALVQGYTEPVAEYFTYYGYIFYGMLAFIVPWLILFLFAFFHTFAKNKRFMMWYVKLYSWIPGLIGLAIILVPKFFDKIAGWTGIDESWAETGMLDMFKTILEGMSSTMWISGICFVLLWLVSIFWAFPIKHNIRKERKLAKQSGSSFGGGPAGGAPNGGNFYQPPYGNNNSSYGNNNPYGNNNNPYGNNNSYGNNNPYGNNNYGGNSYGVSPYGQPPYGGNAYGNPYDKPYGGILDQDAYDHGGFNAPYTGSFYGFDEDDF